ncbi:MAG: NAD-dependent epimerase/dehydratase family protein [Fibrobacterota bacterium]|nr:NAD-dependent epimerase/dehydratase family protein [Fibrobacterota bacterium]
MPKVVVTGAYGFIGRHVSRHFSRAGWTVSGMGHGSWSHDEWKPWGLGEWHYCDITLETLLTYAGEPDAIVHCAGSGSVAFSMTHPLQDFGRTVTTMQSVLEFVRLHSPKTKVAYPSSGAVYGKVETLPIREDFPILPTSPYGVHKYMAEEICQSYARHFGCAISIVRLFSVYGPELKKQLLWDACNKIRSGDVRFAGTGEELRDWLHVEDAAALLYAATERARTECTVVNGASGSGVRVRDILVHLIGCCGKDLKPSFSNVSRAGDPPKFVADIASAGGLMGWLPAIPWQTGIRDYVHWFESEMS